MDKTPKKTTSISTDFFPMEVINPFFPLHFCFPNILTHYKRHAFCDIFFVKIQNHHFLLQPLLLHPFVWWQSHWWSSCERITEEWFLWIVSCLLCLVGSSLFFFPLLFFGFCFIEWKFIRDSLYEICKKRKSLGVMMQSLVRSNI